MRTRSSRAARSFASSMMSSIWLALVRTMISGSSKPGGADDLLDLRLADALLVVAGVADT